MYQKGDLIIYGGHGVCRVLDIGAPNIPGAKKNALYYTLSPLYADGLIYIPVDTNIFMRPVISRSEAENLISRLPEIKEVICRHGNIMMLRQRYDDYLKTYDCESLFKIIKGIYLKAKKDKKMGQTDQAYMKQAEKMLYGELATALGIPFSEVVPYIEHAMASIKA